MAPTPNQPILHRVSNETAGTHSTNADNAARWIIQQMCEDANIREMSHNYACDHLGLPHTTTFGGNESDPTDIKEEDPRYDVYWDLFARFHTKVLAAAIAQNTL